MESLYLLREQSMIPHKCPNSSAVEENKSSSTLSHALRLLDDHIFWEPGILLYFSLLVMDSLSWHDLICIVQHHLLLGIKFDHITFDITWCLFLFIAPQILKSSFSRSKEDVRTSHTYLLSISCPPLTTLCCWPLVLDWICKHSP